MPHGKTPLLGLSAGDLRQVAQQHGLPAFAGGQMAKWLYQQRVSDIAQMTNLSLAGRERLAEHYVVGCVPPAESQRSADGTVKYLFPVACQDDGRGLQRYVETVYIPDGSRATVCVSCQVGCKMNCLFCQTGKQGWQGNLTVADILNQVYSLPERDTLTNIVFMGQGEPMDNLDNVLKATQLLTAPDGFGWSPKRITVSSVGIRGKLRRFLDESQCHVAISMHSPLHDQRQQLMPSERQMAIAEVVELLRRYDFSHQRRCSFEYICFAHLNDSLQHARQLVGLVRGIDCRVNLIRFHPIPGVDLPASDEQRMQQMRDYLTAHGVFATIRASRGQDILAACGLLSTDATVRSLDLRPLASQELQEPSAH